MGNQETATLILVLGASGDLAKKKTFPALFSLLRYGSLPPNTFIVGYARTVMSREEFYKHSLGKALEDITDQELIKKFKDISYYVSGDYVAEEAYLSLSKFIEKQASDIFPNMLCNRIYYLALPPEVFPDVIRGLKTHVYRTPGYNRLIIEKPFGSDLDSCNELFEQVHKYWEEDEVYRIDHFLGKDIVSGLVVLRFSNRIFKFICNKEHVEYVEIILYEDFGTEGRSGYFDKSGIIRDVMQNHMLQIFSLLAMEDPHVLTPENIRDAKVELLKQVPPINPDEVLVGQYIRNDELGKMGYLDDDGVSKDSIVPTFAAVVLRVSNHTWSGVPFILKCGKAMDCKKTEINFYFRTTDGNSFSKAPRTNFAIRVQPDELFSLGIIHKKPGLSSELCLSDLKMKYKDNFRNVRIPEAYEALILDVINGNSSSFVRRDELEYAWKLITPVLKMLEEKKVKPEPYVYGSSGPKSLEQFTQRVIQNQTPNP